MPFLRLLKKEFLHVFPIFLYFLIFFTLLNTTQVYLYKQVGLTQVRFIEIVIASSLIAKIMLVLDHMVFIDLFKRYALVYGILWKTAIYYIVLLLVRLLIRFVPFWYHTANFSLALTQFLEGVNWHLFLSIQTYYLMLLFIFVAFRELTLRIGVQKTIELFFKSPKN